MSASAWVFTPPLLLAGTPTAAEKVLCNPAEFPVGRSFEELLYVAGAAYQKQTGGEVFTHLPAYDYETYSNENGWPEA